MKYLNSLIVGFFCLLLVSCGGLGPVRPVQNADNALVYGNIQLPGDKVVSQLIMHEYRVTYITPFKNPPQAHVYDNGDFFFENVKPGTYYLHRFLSGRTLYVFPYESMKEVDAATFEVKPGDVIYIGSFEVVNEKEEYIVPGSFELKALANPDSLSILRHIAEITRGTGWDKRIESHIDQSMLSQN